MSRAGHPQAPGGQSQAEQPSSTSNFGIERSDAGVVTLTLRQPGRPVVVLDWDLLRAIDSALDEVEAIEGLAGFVLTSDSRVFIAGANLKEIMDLSDAELHAYLRFGQEVYGRIARLPVTTVAAINGAALGGGLEIAMHCDHLIGAEPPAGTPEKPARPYQVGLPEAGLSICPGWGGTNLLPARMEPGRAIELTASGRTMAAPEAAQAGVLEALAPAAELLNRARAIAARPKAARRSEPISIAEPQRRDAARAALERVRASLPETQAARAVASCVEEGLRSGWQAALDAEREHLVRLRGTAEGQSAIRQFFEKCGSR